MSESTVNPATVEFVKQQEALRRKRRAVASVVGLLLVAGISAGGYFGWSKYRANQQAALVKELAAGGFENRDKVRQAVESGQITREQARAAREAAFEAEFQKRIDGYFSTPAKEREKFLDALIDEQQKRMAEWQRNRPTTRPDRDGDRDRPTSRPSEEEREARGRARADNQSPVQRAQRSEFMAAMQARMAERGIQLGWGGRGGRWGGGGGRGGR